MREQPDHAQTLCILGVIDAGLGRKDERFVRAGGERALTGEQRIDQWLAFDAISRSHLRVVW